MTRRISTLLVALLAALVAGCGGSDATAAQRIDRCLDEQPDATKADCKEWEADGELTDEGTHKGHEDM